MGEDDAFQVDTVDADSTIDASDVDVPIVEQSQTATTEEKEDVKQVTYTLGSKVEEITVDDLDEDGYYTIELDEAPTEDNQFVMELYEGVISKNYQMKFVKSIDDEIEYGDFKFKFKLAENAAVEEETTKVVDEAENKLITEMVLDVAGQKITVTSEDDGIDTQGYYPLENKELNVDLTGFTPVELTKVKIDSLIVNGEAVEAGKIAWKYTTYSSGADEKYTVSGTGDMVDLSYGTCSTLMSWELEVGDGDQSNPNNVRYFVNTQVTDSNDWLVPTVYVQNDDGTRSSVSVADSLTYYSDYSPNSDRRMYVYTYKSDMGDNNSAYLSLSLNSEINYSNSDYETLKVFEGYHTEDELSDANDITDKILNGDGYEIENNEYVDITIVSYNKDGEVTGCLPVELYMYAVSRRISLNFMNSDSGVRYGGVSSSKLSDGTIKYTFKKYDADADETDMLYASYYDENSHSIIDEVTAVYEGQYSSIADANSHEATDIKDSFFNKVSGYNANYKDGAYFTIFVGADGDNQTVYKYLITLEQDELKKSQQTTANFIGLCDGNENNIDNYYLTDSNDDSYVAMNYYTMIVSPGTDLTNLAICYGGADLYVEGSDTPEVSGKTVRDFSNGPIKYNVLDENGNVINSYWLSVVTTDSSVENYLYVNGQNGANVNRHTEDGVVYLNREVTINGYNGYVHNIFLANLGKEDISKISAELVSDTLELDEYWTLSGNNDLEALNFGTYGYQGNGVRLNNLAKICLRAKDGIGDSASVLGTLTIKSDGKTIMVINLNGEYGNPVITTDSSLPNATVNEAYSVKLENNNRYSNNPVGYYIESGSLPRGLKLDTSTGVISGTPTVAGTYNFTLKLFTYTNTATYKDFTLVVLDGDGSSVDSDSSIGSDDSDSSSDADDSSSSTTSTASAPSTTSVSAQPTISSSTNGTTATGWDAVVSEVESTVAAAVSNAVDAETSVAATTTTATPVIVNVGLNGTDTVPAKVIDAIAGKNVVLSLAVDTKTLVTISGSQLTAADASDVKLVSAKADDGNETLQVRSQNVNIEKNIVVYSSLGMDKVGMTASLYFVNADNSLVEFRTSPVYENGFAAFETPLVNANYKIALR